MGLFPEPYLARFTYEEQAQDWQTWLATNREDVLLAAESMDNQVIGYVLAQARPDIHPGYDVEILALHVQQAAHGRGIGKALLRAALTELEGRGCQSVMLWTLNGNLVRQWYDRLEGKIIGERVFKSTVGILSKLPMAGKRYPHYWRGTDRFLP